MSGKRPDILPIFPLSGALLLPGGQLPLNIFEPRYVAMIDAAMATKDRLIGMIQPQGDGLSHIGCAGRIHEFSETDDGRYLISLLGQQRFTIQDELPMQDGYRRIKADWSDYTDDDTQAAFIIDDETMAHALLHKLQHFMTQNHIECNWDILGQVVPDPQFLTAMAMLCPFNPQEKQALLESSNAQQRTDLLLAILEMGCCGTCQGQDSVAH